MKTVDLIQFRRIINENYNSGEVEAINILISGGAKNGKSYFAQKLAKQMADEQGIPLYYFATMIPKDEEDHARIRRHVSERAGWGFETVECGTNLMSLLRAGAGEGAESADPVGIEASGPAPVDSRGAFLLDSVTALLSNEMFDEQGNFDSGAAERVARECTAFAKATGNTVFVSDYIYGDADRYDELTECYRAGLARVDRELAKVCERVVEVSAGTTEEWK